MKLLLSLLCLFTFACTEPQLVKTDVENYKVPLESEWNFCVFDVESDFAYGRAFIADNEILTAKHIFSKEDPGINDDVLILGKSEFHGLNLCKIPVNLNELVYYRSKEGLKFLMVVHVEDKFIGVIPLQPIKRGDSGSPVICLKHGDVIGIVSHLIEDPNGTCVAGEIARIH